MQTKNVEALKAEEHPAFVPVIDACLEASSVAIFLIGRLRRLADAIEKDMNEEGESLANLLNDRFEDSQ